MKEINKFMHVGKRKKKKMGKNLNKAVKKILGLIGVFFESIAGLVCVLTLPLWMLGDFEASLIPFFSTYLVIYVGIALAFIFKPIIGFGILSVIFIFVFLTGLKINKESEEEKTSKTSGTEEKSSTHNNVFNMFAGLSKEEARRKYRKLMKELHPDNNGGKDQEECEKVNAAYEAYKKHMA